VSRRIVWSVDWFWLLLLWPLLLVEALLKVCVWIVVNVPVLTVRFYRWALGWKESK
jgi:hypothetical protein